MKNHPLSSIKVSERTFQMIQNAVEKSGMERSEVIRWAIFAGLRDLEMIGFDTESAAFGKKVDIERLSDGLSLKPIYPPAIAHRQKEA